MGLLNLFGGKSAPQGGGKLERIPSGSFTMDATGRINASTLPRSFSEQFIRDIGEAVIAAFRGAKDIGVPLKELHLYYAGAKITAKSLRGGAIVFVAPRRV